MSCPRCKGVRECDHDYCNACNDELIEKFKGGEMR